MTVSITMLSHNSECHYAECRILFNIMLNVVMLSVILLNIDMLSVFMLNIDMLSVVMLNIDMLSVVMLSVMTPLKYVD